MRPTEADAVLIQFSCLFAFVEGVDEVLQNKTKKSIKNFPTQTNHNETIQCKVVFLDFFLYFFYSHCNNKTIVFCTPASMYVTGELMLSALCCNKGAHTNFIFGGTLQLLRQMDVERKILHQLCRKTEASAQIKCHVCTLKDCTNKNDWKVHLKA